MRRNKSSIVIATAGFVLKRRHLLIEIAVLSEDHTDDQTRADGGLKSRSTSVFELHIEVVQ